MSNPSRPATTLGRLALALASVLAVGCGQASPDQQPAPEPPDGPDEAAVNPAQVRAHLAEEFVTEPWYSGVEVVATAEAVNVEADVAGFEDPRATAEEICTAVAGAPEVRTVRVRYDSQAVVSCS